jgi:hypothetical protein
MISRIGRSRSTVSLLVVFLFIIIFIAFSTRAWTPSLSSRPDGIVSLKRSLHERETTIVVGYFPLSKAKHSQSEYLAWLKNLLSFCQSPMIVFTTTELRPVLYQLRRNGSLPSFFIVDYQSPLQMPPIKPLVSTFERQYQTDPERTYHSVELYAVWCAKSFMLNRSAALNPFRTEYFLYVDAGAFRSSNYRFRKWPDSDTIHTILSNNKFLLGMIAPLPHKLCPLNYTMKEGPIKMDLIEGTFMAGSSAAVRWWTSVFYKTIDEYRSRNIFIGKDQSIMNAIALVHADRLNMLLPFRAVCSDVWFAFGALLAKEKERETLSYSVACQNQNASEIIIPFETVCRDRRNLVRTFSSL